MICWNYRLLGSLLFILWGLLYSPNLFAQEECPVKPDAALKDAKTGGKPFINCTSASTPSYTLRVQNVSQTKESNTSYTINWGDGSPIEDLGDFSTVKSHVYTRLDTYKILFTVKIGNCAETREYTFFNGNVPDITVRYKIDDCAPVSDYFIIDNVNENEASTTYTIDFGDGSSMSFSQRDLIKYKNPDPQAPNSYAIPHTYAVPSFGKELGYEVVVTATNTCRTVTRSGSGIFVYKGPTPDFKMSPEPVSCLNSPVTLTDVSDYGYNATDPSERQFERQWTIEPMSGQPATSWSFAPGYNEKSEQPIINFNQTGDYKITINLLPLEGTSPKCEGGTVAKVLKVITPPTANFSASLNPVSGCASTVTTTNNSVGDLMSYQWTITPNSGYTITSGSLTSAAPVFQFNTAGNYQLALKVTNYCGTDQKSTTFQIKNIPTVTLPAAKAYCGPQTIAFSSTNAAHKPTYNLNNTTEVTYAWNITGPANGATFTNPGGETSPNPSINFTQAGTYTVAVAVTNECGTSTKATQTVTINAIPDAPDAANASICINSAATLTTTATGTVEWWSASVNGTKLKTGSSYTTPVYSTAGTYTVYVQTTVNGCTSPRKAVTITVNPAIDPKTIIGAAPICEGNSPNALTGSAATGGGGNITYLWESSTTSATATDFKAATGKDNSPNNLQNFQPGILPKGTWYFRRKAIASPCATAVSNVVMVTVNPLPIAPIVPAINPVCAGNTATLIANAVNGITYTWYDATGTVLPNGASNSNTYTTAALTQEGTYTFYVTGTNSNNCTSPRTQVSVQVLPAITDNQIFSLQPAICAGETPGQITSDGKPSGGNGYDTFTFLWQSKTDRDTEWKTAANGPDANYANNKENYQPTAITRTTAFRRMITSGSCATPSYSNEVVIQVIPSSLAPEVAEVAPICVGQSTKIEVTSTGGMYEWFATPTSTDVIYTGSTFATPDLSATTIYYVHNRSTNCVSPRTSVTVTVNPLITENTITPVPPACADGTPNKLIGSEPKNGAGPGTYTYLWESRTEFGSFSPINGDLSFSKDKKDYQPGTLTEPTWFRRIARSGNCENVSAEIKVDVLKVITGNTITAVGGTEFCAGAVSTKFTGSEAINGGNGQYAYIWESSTDEFKTIKTVVAQGQGAAFAEYTPQNVTQTTWFRRIVSSGPCQATTSNIIKITVNPLPATPVVGPIEPVCSGSSAIIKVTPVNGITFLVSDEAGNSIPSSNGKEFTTTALTGSKTYTYSVIAKNSNNCSSTRTTVTVQVLAPLRNFNISQPAPVCSGESPSEITSTGTPAGGNNTYTYIWQSKTGQEEFKSITTASSNPNFKPGALTETTLFRRIITSGACSEYSNIIEVKVNQPVVNTLKSANQEICADVRPDKILGNPATGGDGVNYTYLWQSSLDNNIYADAAVNPSESNAQVDYQPILLTKGNYWFRRKVVSGSCISYSTPILIKVNQPISENAIALTGNAAICINTKPGLIQGSVPKGGNEQPTYLWKISTNGVTFTDAPQPNTGKDYTPGVLDGPTWFQRIVNSGNCLPSTSPSVKVEVYQPVTNNTIRIPNQNVCKSSEAPTLIGSQPSQGNGKYEYVWESSRDNITFTTAANNPFEKDYSPGYLAKGNWYFRRRVTSGPCTSVNSESVKLVVSDEISGHFITANQTIRVGDKPAPLTGPKPNGGNGNFTYRWKISENNQIFTDAPGNFTQQSYAPPVLSKTTWFRRIATSGGCESESNLVEITIAQAIANNTITASQTICYNSDAATLTGSVPTGGDGDYTFIWEYSHSGSATDFVTAPNLAYAQDYQPGKLKETTWFRRKVSSAGNTHTSNLIKITVTDPITSNSITGSQAICYGTSPAGLTGSAIVGGSGLPDYLWESSTDGTNYLTTSGNSNQATYVPGPLTRTTWFRRKVTMAGCTSNISNTVQITVIAPPVIAPVQPIQICPGTSTTITVQSSATQIEWFETATSTTVIHKGASFTTPVLQENRTFYVQATDQGCSGERQAVTITIGLPVADAGADVTIKPGSSTQLQGKGGVSYRWSPAEGLSDPNIANPVANPKQSTTYTLTVTTAEGCTATDQVLVSLTPGLFIPNGFTPDRDGINDTWEITNIDKYPNCQVKIFNRWGTVIYTSEGYKQPWNGTYNQQDLPVATYYYTIILNKDEKPISGSVTIIK